MRSLLTLSLIGLLLLAACSYTITVDLPSQTFQVPPLPNTQGMILYKKDPLSFSPPPVAPKSVVILGTLEANQPLSTTLGFYVRLKDPSACQDLGQAYLCPIGADDERAGEARFEESASAPLTLGGRNLTQGVAQGRFWLGLEVQGLPSQGGVFTLKDPKAMLTVGF